MVYTFNLGFKRLQGWTWTTLMLVQLMSMWKRRNVLNKFKITLYYRKYICIERRKTSFRTKLLLSKSKAKLMKQKFSRWMRSNMPWRDKWMRKQTTWREKWMRKKKKAWSDKYMEKNGLSINRSLFSFYLSLFSW